MRNRIVSLAVTLVLLLALLPAVPVLADDSDYGFTIEGWYSDSQTQYGFIIDETEVGYNGEVPYYWYYDEIWTGSAVYVPIGYLNNRGDETHAGFRSLNEKNDNVTISYKATAGGEYIESVTLVDGSKEKITGLPNGAYAKIQLTDTYTGTGSGVKIVVNFGLSVRGVYHQDTDTQLTLRMWNPLVNINRNTVYGAQSPAQYETGHYNGEATFDMGGGVRYTAFVGASAKYVINFSRAQDPNIAAMYPNDYLEFYNFRGNNDTFASVGRLEIPIDTTKFRGADGNPVVYAYQIDGSTLRAIDSSTASYNASTKVLTIRTQTLNHYVLANRSLLQTVSSNTDDTFRSGYAAQQPNETAAIEAEQESGVTATPANEQQPAQADATPSGATAAEEPANDNPGTGSGVINAANGTSDNPSTGPAGPLLPMLGATLLAGGGGAVYWKRARPFAKED